MTPYQKLRSIADSTGLDGIADAIREIANEIEHNNAPAVPQGFKPVGYLRSDEFDGHTFEPINGEWPLGELLFSATPAPAPAPAQGEPFGYFRAEPFGWTDCSEDAEGAIALYEHPAKPAQDVGLTDEPQAHVASLSEGRRELDAIDFFESKNRDSHGFKKSVRGTYVNPAVARDWKWFQLGMKHATEDES